MKSFVKFVIATSIVTTFLGGFAVPPRSVQARSKMATTINRPKTVSSNQVDLNQWVFIRAKHSEQCLNILGGSFENGALATQGQGCDSEYPNFVWRISVVFRQTDENGTTIPGSEQYVLMARHSSQCLNVLGNSPLNGAAVVQGSRCANPLANFRWRLKQRSDGYFLIQNVSTGQCLNVLNWDQRNGGLVVQGKGCNKPTTNFLWTIEPAGPFYNN